MAMNSVFADDDTNGQTDQIRIMEFDAGPLFRDAGTACCSFFIRIVLSHNPNETNSKVVTIPEVGLSQSSPVFVNVMTPATDNSKVGTPSSTACINTHGHTDFARR